MGSTLPCTAASASRVEECDIARAGGAWKALIIHCLLIWSTSTLLFAGLVVYLDNTNLVTTNGLWKSMRVRKWVEAPPGGIEPPNFAYFPTTALMVGLMPESVFGPVYRRMAFLNTFWAGLALAFTYLIVRSLGVGLAASLAAVAIQVSCGHFLALAVMSEDIMAGYAFMMGAVALAVYSFHRLDLWGYLGLLGSALLFDLSWLFEWRLMFPIAPALGLALLTARGSWAGRLMRLLLYVAFALLLVMVAAFVWRVADPALQDNSLLSLSKKLLWTGKGMGTGWAGFAGRKWVFLWAGMTQYWLGGHNVGRMDYILKNPQFAYSLAELLFILILGAVFARRVIVNWNRPAWRTAGLVLGGTFVSAQAMNLYGQPQDPQFQINAMAWFAVAWAALMSIRLPLRRWPAARPVLLSGLAVAFLWSNVWGTNGFHVMRGKDSVARGQVAELAGRADFSSTVFVFHGGEGIITWLVADLGLSKLEYPPKLGKAPQEQPLVKFMFLRHEAVSYPNRSPEEAAASVCDSIDEYLRNGFSVIANRIWDSSEEAFVSSFATVSGSDKPRAIHRAMHTRYVETLLFEVHGLGRFYELRPRESPVTAIDAIDGE